MGFSHLVEIIHLGSRPKIGSRAVCKRPDFPLDIDISANIKHNNGISVQSKKHMDIDKLHYFRALRAAHFDISAEPECASGFVFAKCRHWFQGLQCGVADVAAFLPLDQIKWSHSC
jgi:hypothetical protein